MLTPITSQVRIFFCLQPTDMRLSFSGLTGLVRTSMGADPISGHLFVFRNRRGDRLKILSWGGDGFVLWYKQLEQGTFHFPMNTCQKSVEIDRSTLMLILDGIDLQSVRRLKRYQRQNTIQPTAVQPMLNSAR